MSNSNTFRDIPHYEGYYEINPEGVVRSKARTTVNSLGVTKHYRGRVLKHSLTPRKQPKYNLSKDNEMKSYLRESLIYITFPELDIGVVDLEGEYWLPIPECEQHAISNKGRVKRLGFDRTLGVFDYTCKDRLITPTMQNGERLRVSLHILPTHRKKDVRTIRLDLVNTLYSIFVGEIPHKHRAILVDGDITNITAENFRVEFSYQRGLVR